jgi:hypothetical protein
MVSDPGVAKPAQNRASRTDGGRLTALRRLSGFVYGYRGGFKGSDSGGGPAHEPSNWAS